MDWNPENVTAMGTGIAAVITSVGSAVLTLYVRFQSIKSGKEDKKDKDELRAVDNDQQQQLNKCEADKAQLREDLSRALLKLQAKVEEKTNGIMVKMNRARILLVEDSADARDAMARLLEMRGCLVTTCPTGGDAIDITKHHKFDMVFLDIMTPGKTGLDFLADTKGQVHCPVIVMTAHPDMVVDPTGSSFVEIMSKPLDSDKVEQALVKYIPGKVRK